MAPTSLGSVGVSSIEMLLGLKVLDMAHFVNAAIARVILVYDDFFGELERVCEFNGFYAMDIVCHLNVL